MYNQRQRGFVTAEIAFGIAIVTFIVLYLLSNTEPVQNRAKETALILQITEVINGAREWGAAQNDGYNSVSMTELSDDNKINTEYGDGSGQNSFGGNLTVADGTTTNDLLVTATGLPTESCANVAEKLSRWTTATCTTGTVTVTTI